MGMKEKGSEKVSLEKGIIKGDRWEHRPQKLGSESNLLSAFRLAPGPSLPTS